MILLDGQPYAPGTPFTRSGIQYPGNWYQCATPTERTDTGFTDVADPEPYDQRFWVGRDNQGVLIPRSPADVKTWIIDEARATAYQIISKNYDWQAMRAFMLGQTCPSQVATDAAAVRTRCNDIESESEAAAILTPDTTAIEALEAIDRSFASVTPELEP
jgi:hypothetical protein